MDKLNEQWLGHEPNFYFRYKRKILEKLIEGSCLNVGCGSHLIPSAENIDEGLPHLPYEDASFDTVICSDVLEHIGPHKQAFVELFRIARKKVIITVPAHMFLFGEYDRVLGHKRRYTQKDFPGFSITHLFWFLVPILFLRKIFNLRHRPLPSWLDRFFFRLAHWHAPWGTTVMAIKTKMPREAFQQANVSVFIPLYNERKIIRKAVQTVRMVLDAARINYELVIVNDASTDESQEECEKLAGEYENIRVVSCKEGPTRRENLAQSFRQARGDVIVFVDVDLVMSLRFLPDLIFSVLEGADIVTGSRYLPQSRIMRRTFRLVVSKIYNRIIRVLFQTGIKDHMCGFKAFKKDVVLSLVQEMDFDNTLCRGIFWDTELIVRARRKRYVIKEIPIWWKERKKTALCFNREVRAVPFIVRFWLAWIHNKI